MKVSELYRKLLNVHVSSDDDDVVQSVAAGTNVTVDNTDPGHPIVSASGGGGGGGAPDDWMMLEFTGGHVLVESTHYDIPFEDNDYLAPPRGTSITWDVGTPTTIHIVSAGRYDLMGLITFINQSATTTSNVETILAMDSSAHNFELGELLLPGDQRSVTLSIPGLYLPAGDNVYLDAIASNIDVGTLRASGALLVLSRVA